MLSPCNSLIFKDPYLLVVVITSTFTRYTFPNKTRWATPIQHLGTYNFTGMSLFTGCGQSLVSTTRGSRTRRVLNCWKRWCLEEIQLSELPGKIASFIGRSGIIFEAPLQMQCKSITLHHSVSNLCNPSNSSIYGETEGASLETMSSLISGQRYSNCLVLTTPMHPDTKTSLARRL